MISLMKADRGQTYTLERTYTFNAAKGEPNLIGVKNGSQDTKNLGFGLAQGATVDGQKVSPAPESFVPLPQGAVASLDPNATVTIWLSPYPSGTIASTSSRFSVNLTPQSPTATIGYHLQSGWYVISQ